MNIDTVARLTFNYTETETQLIFETSKDQVLAKQQRIRERVEKMAEFTEFPEGVTGVLIYNMLEMDADISDISHIKQGCEKILKAAGSVVVEEVDNFGFVFRNNQ